MRITEHLRPGLLKHELGKCDERRDPPVPVTVWLHLDGQEHEAVLHGWAASPNGADDGRRGLVYLVREYAPGFGAELLTWVRAENIRQR